MALDAINHQGISAAQDRFVIRPGWIACALVASIVALALLMRIAGLSIDPLAPATQCYALAFALLAAVRWSCRRPATPTGRMARDMSEYFGLFAAVSLVGAVASYPVAYCTHGFVDAILYQCDLAMHFHWLDWYRTVATHPWLQLASRTAYEMIYISPAILLGYLAWIDHRHEAHEFIATVWLAALLTLVIFRFIPAVGPFAYLWHQPPPYLPVSDLWQPTLIPELRDQTARVVDLGHLVGLVSAPSFHTAAAVLLIVFAARHPAIRVPLIAINVAMLLATPVEGTHYLTDMILGGLVAFASLGAIAFCRRVFAEQCRRRRALVANC